METKTITKILYFIVMPQESENIIKTLSMIKDDIFSNKFSNLLESFYLKQDNSEIIIVRPVDDPFHKNFLFGTEIAFTLTYLGIQHYSPHVVVNMGYAGNTGYNKELKLGDVVIAKDKTVYHRREMIIDRAKPTSEGNYPLFDCSKLVKELGYHYGLVGTSNSFVKHDDIAFKAGIVAVEMEICSVNRAAFYFGTPCIGVKIISDGDEDDNVDAKTREKRFLESLEIMQKTLHSTFITLNKYLLNKKISDL